MTALEAEYTYLILRAARRHEDGLAQKLIVDAMKHDFDLSHLVHPER